MVKSIQGMLFIFKSHLAAGAALNCLMQWHHSVSCGTVSAQCLWFWKGQNMGSIVVSKVAQNWPYLSSFCFSPLAADWCTNTAQTCFSVLQLPELYCSCLLDWTESSQTNTQAILFFDTSILWSYTLLWYFHSLFPTFCMHSPGQRSFSYMLHCLSGTVSLAKLDHQTHSCLLNHLWNLTSSGYPVDSWVSVHVHTQSWVNRIARRGEISKMI